MSDRAVEAVCIKKAGNMAVIIGEASVIYN